MKTIDDVIIHDSYNSCLNRKEGRVLFLFYNHFTSNVYLTFLKSVTQKKPVTQKNIVDIFEKYILAFWYVSCLYKSRGDFSHLDQLYYKITSMNVQSVKKQGSKHCGVKFKALTLHILMTNVLNDFEINFRSCKHTKKQPRYDKNNGCG